MEGVCEDGVYSCLIDEALPTFLACSCRFWWLLTRIALSSLARLPRRHGDTCRRPTVAAGEEMMSLMTAVANAINQAPRGQEGGEGGGSSADVVKV